jgi:LPXTG-site transpeptidase (sortase) family protein
MYKAQKIIFEPKRYKKASSKSIVTEIKPKIKKTISISRVDFAVLFIIFKVVWNVGLPFIFLMSGLIIIATQIIIPSLSGQVTKDFIKPLATDVLAFDSATQVLTGSEEFEFSELTVRSENITNSNKYFPPQFTITVPKLGIEDFVIDTNSTNLSPDKALGHYKGSCLPGEICSGRSDSFIFGHSALPAFYDPTDPKKVFSKLDDLSPGDKFFVNYNGEELIYKVNFKKIIEPNKLDPLNPPNPFSIGKPTMTLMTCFPPGTTNERLVVSAELMR